MEAELVKSGQRGRGGGVSIKFRGSSGLLEIDSRGRPATATKPRAKAAGLHSVGLRGPTCGVEEKNMFSPSHDQGAENKQNKKSGFRVGGKATEMSTTTICWENAVWGGEQDGTGSGGTPEKLIVRKPMLPEEYGALVRG